MTMLKSLLIVPVTLLTIAAAEQAAAGIAVGDKLAPFALKDASGKVVDLASVKVPKAAVVIFVATRCPVSNAYNTRMEALARDYGSRGVLFFGVNANREESVAEIADHARTHGLSFPVLKDDGNVQADRFGAQVTPEAYVFDSTWSLRYHGRVDDARDQSGVTRQDLRLALDAVLAGDPVSPAETKAFGCTIKRVTP
jgi:peroxiredoxin